MRVALREPDMATEFEGAFARPGDYAVCQRLHRKYSATYYFATRRFGAEMRRRTHALYAFVRIPDEWVDNPKDLSPAQCDSLITGWRSQLIRGLDGVTPPHPVMRAFCDVVRETSMPLEEPLLFLDAMKQDLFVSRYSTYGALRQYMRGSAAAVGVMMCSVLGVPDHPKVHKAAKALGEAMQLTNFLRDIGEDIQRQRIYMPLEDMATFGVRDEDLRNRRLTPGIEKLIRFQIARARALYEEADAGIRLLPAEGRRPVKLARILYAMILDKIEDHRYDVFTRRLGTSKVEKLLVAARVLLAKD